MWVVVGRASRPRGRNPGSFGNSTSGHPHRAQGLLREAGGAVAEPVLSSAARWHCPPTHFLLRVTERDQRCIRIPPLPSRPADVPGHVEGHSQ